MKIARCDDNKHFYDADSFDACPHCKKEQNTEGLGSGTLQPRAEPAMATMPNMPTGSQSVTFYNNNENNEAAPIVPADKPEPQTPSAQNASPAAEMPANTIYCTSCGKPMLIAQQFCTSCGSRLTIPDIMPETISELRAKALAAEPSNSQTGSLWQRSQVTAQSSSDAPEDLRQSDDKQIGSAEIPSPNAVAAAVLPEGPNGTNEPSEPIGPAAPASAETVAIYGNRGKASMIVGWIVCVKGDHIGQSFEIKSGQNHIGRSENMNIALFREASISRNRHASIIFEPSKQVYYIQQGEGSGLTYLNGELVINYLQLNAYDKLQLGHAEFVFVPLLNEQFTWDVFLT